VDADFQVRGQAGCLDRFSIRMQNAGMSGWHEAANKLEAALISR